MAFKVGDVVILKSGGPMLTVRSCSVTTETQSTGGLVNAHWFDDSGKWHNANLPSDCLDLYDNYVSDEEKFRDSVRMEWIEEQCVLIFSHACQMYCLKGPSLRHDIDLAMDSTYQHSPSAGWKAVNVDEIATG